MTTTKEELKQILKNYWGYSDFREGQYPCIAAILEGHSGLVLMPTGGGKSLCYQLPALTKKGVCLVISPLVALIEDQIAILKQKNIIADTIVAGANLQEIDRVFNNCRYGSTKFLYLSPERFSSQNIQERLLQLDISFIAIDEAHCISQWGHDFRPSYLKLKVIQELFPDTSILALTATATPEVKRDIVNQLFQSRSFHVFESSFFRSNLSYGAYKTPDKRAYVLRILKKYPGSAIIYVNSRILSYQFASFLKSEGISSGSYHAGLSKATKQKVFSEWKNNRLRVMVATNAFGMGIDKKDVRLVIHINIPLSLEAYFQEAGRAGRDMQKAYAMLLYNTESLEKWKTYYTSQAINVSLIKKVHQKLFSFLKISSHETLKKIYRIDLEKFIKKYEFPNSTKIKKALRLLESQDQIRTYPPNDSEGYQIKCLLSVGKFRAFADDFPVFEPILDYLSRNYENLYFDRVSLQWKDACSSFSFSEEVFQKRLSQLKVYGVLDYYVSGYWGIEFLTTKYTALQANAFLGSNLKQYEATQQMRFKAMTAFVSDRKVCKSVQLLRYFGEHSSQDCGICSVCIAKQKQSPTVMMSQDTNHGAVTFISNDDEQQQQRLLEAQIITAIQQKPQTSRSLCILLDCDEHLFLKAINHLLKAQKITITSMNTYTLL